MLSLRCVLRDVCRIYRYDRVKTLLLVKNYNNTDWKQHVSDLVSFSRVRVFSGEKDIDDCMDLRIITWPKDYKTCIHDHPKNGCIFKVLKGKILEKRYKLTADNIPVLQNENIFEEGGVSYIDNNEGVHRLINVSDKRSVTMHFYPSVDYEAQKFFENE